WSSEEREVDASGYSVQRRRLSPSRARNASTRFQRSELARRSAATDTLHCLCATSTTRHAIHPPRWDPVQVRGKVRTRSRSGQESCGAKVILVGHLDEPRQLGPSGTQVAKARANGGRQLGLTPGQFADKLAPGGRAAEQVDILAGGGAEHE